MASVVTRGEKGGWEGGGGGWKDGGKQSYLCYELWSVDWRFGMDPTILVTSL